MDLMLNTYVPFPRYENAVFFGDKAAETLAALRIFGRALIGGDIPSMETLHPAEKMLECTQCALRNRPKIFDAAVRRMHADYVLLEANGRIGLDPSVLAAPLAEAGISVKVLDVRGPTVDVIRRAGALYGEERQAERVVRDYEARLRAVHASPSLPPLRILPLLGIRHPIEDQVHVFAATPKALLTAEIIERLGCRHALEGVECARVALEGLVPIDRRGLAALAAEARPDVAALCGDASAAGALLAASCAIGAKELRSVPALALPWHGPALEVRLPRTLEIWKRTLGTAFGTR